MHFKGEGERGQARAERLALFRDSLTSLPCFASMAVILQSLAKDNHLESIAQALPPVGVMVPVRGGTLIARLPKLTTDDPRGPPSHVPPREDVLHHDCGWGLGGKRFAAGGSVLRKF